MSNIVLMGIGEPLDNMDNVLRFLELVNHPDGLNIGMRHISLSTCGVVPGIDALAEQQLQLTLSVSLHAPDSETRSRIMPVNRAYDVEELFAACHRYFQKTGRRISFEYAMIDGVNDHDWQADLIARKLQGHAGPCESHPAERRGGEPLQAQPPRGRLSEAAGVPRRHRHGAAQPGRRHRRLLRPAAPQGHGGKGQEGRPDNEEMHGASRTPGLVRSENQDAYAVLQTAGGYTPRWSATAWAAPTEAGWPAPLRWIRFEQELRRRAAGRYDRRSSCGRPCSAPSLCANDAIRAGGGAECGRTSTWAPRWCAPWPRTDMAIIGNIGDSRAYHITAEGIRQITRDHSVVENMVEQGRPDACRRPATIPTAI